MQITTIFSSDNLNVTYSVIRADIRLIIVTTPYQNNLYRTENLNVLF